MFIHEYDATEAHETNAIKGVRSGRLEFHPPRVRCISKAKKFSEF